ncbi:hypothetical protein MKZ38_003909 [Zalerion maritima]|uniref:Uncharacterized protein n=1 Tax=Zalerion maritima TaxID=339359 RepID=A0AAD5RN94_9PEZI|nr:hypothetical protein MKZ38_003909 [Zalerion maritima]
MYRYLASTRAQLPDLTTDRLINPDMAPPDYQGLLVDMNVRREFGYPPKVFEAISRKIRCMLAGLGNANILGRNGWGVASFIWPEHLVRRWLRDDWDGCVRVDRGQWGGGHHAIGPGHGGSWENRLQQRPWRGSDHGGEDPAAIDRSGGGAPDNRSLAIVSLLTEDHLKAHTNAVGGSIMHQPQEESPAQGVDNNRLEQLRRERERTEMEEEEERAQNMTPRKPPASHQPNLAPPDAAPRPASELQTYLKLQCDPFRPNGSGISAHPALAPPQIPAIPSPPPSLICDIAWNHTPARIVPQRKTGSNSNSGIPARGTPVEPQHARWPAAPCPQTSSPSPYPHSRQPASSPIRNTAEARAEMKHIRHTFYDLKTKFTRLVRSQTARSVAILEFGLFDRLAEQQQAAGETAAPAARTSREDTLLKRLLERLAGMLAEEDKIRRAAVESIRQEQDCLLALDVWASGGTDGTCDDAASGHVFGIVLDSAAGAGRAGALPLLGISMRGGDGRR